MSTIKSLEIKNFQRLSSAVIEPSGNVIMICGLNANGKTSVLDAVETTLCGFNAKFIKRPIKDGAGRADIDIVMDDGATYSRRFTASGSVLTGKAADGAKMGQKDLDKLLSALGVDASAFINAGEKKQLETLLSVVDLPFVPAELDAERKSIFDERTVANRDVKRLEAQLERFLPLPADLPAEETSMSELAAQIEAAQNYATNAKAAQDNVTWWDNQIAEKEDQLRQMIEDLETSKERRKVALARVAEYAAAPEVDVEGLREQLATQEVTNSQIRVSRERAAVATELTEARDTVEQLTTDLQEIDARKADGLAKAEMPVEGLSFDEEGVLYQGIPFSRASGAEQIIVSAAMIIATDPAVRTMVIRNGNVMDTNSLAVLQGMCEENQFQAFVEFVSDSEDHEFRIVDGTLAA